MEQLALFKSKIRTLKIEEDGDFWRGNIRPKIRLRGLWLQQAGFHPGNRVSVNCIGHGVLELRSMPALDDTLPIGAKDGAS
jgi:type I toxin-antitoxin system toxin SymE